MHLQVVMSRTALGSGSQRKAKSRVVVTDWTLQGSVLSIVQAIWSGRLNLAKKNMEDFRMDAPGT